MTLSMDPSLQKHMERVTQLGIFGGKAANHLLLNEYLPGQGIMPHLGNQLAVCGVAKPRVKLLTFHRSIRSWSDQIRSRAPPAT
jgi:hypothetical protein